MNNKILQHKLKNRHLQMIALGGVIGTGLFFGATQSIHLTGVSVLLAYIFCGIIMFIIMRALGEMSIYNPNSGAFSQYAEEYLGPYAGFIAGWNAWFEYTIVCMVELSAVTFFMDYWLPNFPHWAICLVLLILFTSINLISIKFFGEFEFWFASIKIIAIILMLSFTIYLIFFKHIINPDLNLYLQKKYLFANGLQGLLSSLVIIVFSFGGTEFVSIAAGEAEDPKKNIPRAINGVVLRILLFYILTIIAIIFLYPINKLSAHVSPFVDVFQKIGIPFAANIMNLVAITATLSAFNSSLYSSSRILYNLSLHAHAHKKLSKINRNGVPYIATIITSSAIFIAVIINYLFPNKAIMYLLTIATCAILITWFIILITQMRFRILHNKKHLQYKLLLFPYSNIFAILTLFLVLYIMTTMDDMRLSAYVTPFWILLLSISYVMRKKRTFE